MKKGKEWNSIYYKRQEQKKNAHIVCKEKQVKEYQKVEDSGYLWAVTCDWEVTIVWVYRVLGWCDRHSFISKSV